MLFGLRYCVGAEVKDRRGQHGAGVAFGDAFDKVIQRAGPARGDDGDVDRIADGAGQGDVIAGLNAVVVHCGQQDFTCAFFHHGAGEFHSIDACRAAPAMGEDFPPAGGHGFGVDGDDDALAAKAQRGLCHDIGVGDGGRVKADLVRPRQQQGAHVVVGAHAAADGQRHKARLGCAGGKFEHGAAIFFGGHDVEKAKLVRASRVIGDGRVDGVTRIAQADEIHTFDNASVGDIKAGDDPGFQHMGVIPRSAAQGKGNLTGILRLDYGHITKDLSMIRTTLAAAALALPALAAPASAEVITKTTDRTVYDAMNALETAVTDAGATVFARVDHATGAASVDMELMPMELLIFGNPQLGTPALQADGLAGLVLPLKVLVYEKDGQTLIAYEAVPDMFDGLNIPADAEYAAKMAGALDMLTEKAAN
jgi:uncharacterized protein (DUF302 family)